MSDEMIQEFEALFAQDTPPVEEDIPPVVDSPEDTPPAEDSAPPAETPPAEEVDDEAPPAEEEKPPVPSESKLNYAMAKLRTERNEYEALIKDLGAQVGIDPKLSVKDTADKLKELNTQRTAEKYNIPADMAADLVQTKAILAEHAQTQRYIQTTNTLNEMRQKYGFDQAVEDDLIGRLMEEGRNPLDISQTPVDLEAEFLKRYVQDIVTQQRAEAAEAERKRLEEASKAPAALPGTNPGGQAAEGKITTQEGLDAFFNSLTAQ